MSIPDFDLRRYADTLPQPRPGDALFNGIMRAHGRRRAQHRALVGALGVLAVVALAGTWIQRDAQKAPAQTQPLASAPEANALRAADRALQAAYERGADDAEIAALWSRRDALDRGVAAPLPMKL